MFLRPHSRLVFNDNDMKCYYSYIFNFNIATDQLRQNVDQQPNVIASASQDNPSRMCWIDEL